MKRLIIALLSVFVFISQVFAVEIVRQKNVATYVVFPIMKNDGTLITSAAGLDSEIDVFADGAAPDGFADCTNEATEIGSTGQYYLSLSNTELNNDYIIIQIKSSSTGAVTQTLLIRTMVGDPLNAATSDDGGTINVTGGAIDTVTTATNTTTVNGLAANVITSASINDGAITTAELATGCIGSDEIADNAIDAGAIATDAIGAAEIAANAITSSEAANLDAAVSSRSTLTAANVWDTNISAYSGAGYAGTYLKTAFDKLPTNYIMGSSVLTAKDDEIDSILTDTAAQDTSTELRTLLVGSDTALSVLTSSDNIGINWADVSNPTTVLNLSGTSISTSQAIASVSGAVGSVTGGVTVTNNNDKTGYSLSSANIDAIWDEVQSGHVVVGSFGKYLDAQVSTVGGGTAADIADAVWDELLSGHTVTGSTGKKLGDLPTSGTADWTVAEKADILEALSVDDGTANTDLDDIKTQIKIHR